MSYPTSLFLWTCLWYAEIGITIVYPWLLAAWEMGWLKARAWKWILPLPPLLFSGFVISIGYFAAHGTTHFISTLAETCLLIFVAICCIPAALVVLAIAVFSKRQRLRGCRVALGFIGFYLTVYASLFVIGTVGNTKLRLEHDYGVWIPPSAGQIHCNSLTSASPEKTTASFTTSRSDLPKFLAQFAVDSGNDVSSDDHWWPMVPPSNFGKRFLSGYRQIVLADICEIRLGVYDLDANRVGIVIQIIYH